MCDYKIKEFKVTHLDNLEARDYELNDVMKLDNFYERMNMVETVGTNFSLYIKDELISCGGFIPIWQGVFELWQMPSKKVKYHIYTYSKILKKIVNDIASKHKCHRMQTVSYNDKLHVKWMSFLEFKEEGFLRQYSHMKKDYIQWGRLF